METPELEKINTHHEDSQKIGEFIEWLNDDQNITLCTYVRHCDADYEDHDIYAPVTLAIVDLLAKYFGVDLDKAEKERVALLEEIRATNAEELEAL